MSAYDSIRLDDYRQRIANGEQLTPQQQRTLARLEAQGRQDLEAAPRPQWLGGDYPDL